MSEAPSPVDPTAPKRKGSESTSPRPAQRQAMGPSTTGATVGQPTATILPVAQPLATIPTGTQPTAPGPTTTLPPTTAATITQPTAPSSATTGTTVTQPTAPGSAATLPPTTAATFTQPTAPSSATTGATVTQPTAPGSAAIPPPPALPTTAQSAASLMPPPPKVRPFGHVPTMPPKGAKMQSALPHSGKARTGSGKTSHASSQAASGSPSVFSRLLKSQSLERRLSKTRSSQPQPSKTASTVQAEKNEWKKAVASQSSKFPSPRPSDRTSVSTTPPTKTSTSGTASPTVDPAVLFQGRNGLVDPEPLYIYTDATRNLTTTFVYLEFISAGSEGSALKVQVQGGKWHGGIFCLKVFSEKNLVHGAKETRVYRKLQAAASRPGNKPGSNLILRYYHSFEYKNQHCIVLEYCKKTLTQYLNDNTTMTKSETQALCKEVCEGVQYLHTQGYAHRDIKPDNILMVNDHIRIGDLGAATRPGPTGDLTGYYGTRGYSAPENTAAAGCTYTIAVDYFSLGATLHTIIARETFAQSPLEMAKRGRNLNENRITGWDNAKALVDRLIDGSVSRRFSPAQALQHSFFQDKHDGSTQMPQSSSAQPQSSSAQP
ncbi:hypothetical protein BGZ96_004658, partial [Linnemannia gamsii]